MTKSKPYCKNYSIEDVGYSICYVHCDYGYQLNLNLIASAPELLNEMKNLAKSLEDVVELPQSFYDAIAKAEGRG